MKELVKISGLIKKKARKDDLPLIVDYVKKETVMAPIKKQFKERWDLDKKLTLFAITIFPIFLAMFGLYARFKGYPSKREYSIAIWRKDNEKLEREIKKSINKDEKRFHVLRKELNIIGIEQIEKLHHSRQALHKAKAYKKAFIKNPNLPTFKVFLDSLENLNQVSESLIDVLSRKFEKQKELVNQFNSLRSLDDRDIKDLKRALLTDFAISFVGRKALFVATPIEALLKSGKLADKAAIDFLGWSGGFLYIGIVLNKNRQKDYSLWLNNLLHLIESRQNNP